MTAYPAELTRRFAQQLQQLRRDVTKLQNRTAGIDSGATLAVLPAVISSGYTSGNPSVYINGSETLTGPCQYLESYSPAAGDAVLVIPTPITVPGLSAFIVLGKLA
jgi:hypothetical protein